MSGIRHFIFVLRYHGLLGRVVAGLIVFLAIIAAMALALLLPSPAAAGEQPAPGMTCTYTKQGAPFNGGARTYGVQVVGHFAPAQDERMRPWLWVKRSGDANYLTFLAVEADLSECRS